MDDFNTITQYVQLPILASLVWYLLLRMEKKIDSAIQMLLEQSSDLRLLKKIVLGNGNEGLDKRLTEIERRCFSYHGETDYHKKDS